LSASSAVGSGKTTLISLIAGLIEADAGTILLEDKPIEGPGPDRGVIFQNYSLLPWMNVFENVYLAVDAVAPHLTDQEKRQRTEYYLDLVNLGAALKKVPRELSVACASGSWRAAGDGRGVAFGRTLQRPRCADPRHAARRTGAHLDGNPQDRGDDHQRYR
jgi:ABC-type taurine transport system ATPase subunit